jgi:hypothetical protein
LAISWALYPTRQKHGLESWGETFNFPKPKITDWHNLSYEEYENRCSTDVEINRLLWNDIYQYLWELYGSEKKIWEYVEYLSFKLYCARLQEESGWSVDIKRASLALKELLTEKQKKTSQLEKAMPFIVKYEEKNKPKLFFKKDGSFSSRALEWFKILAEEGLPSDIEGPIKVISHEEPPNPNAPQQIKDWLFSLGWKPETFKQVKNKTTGEMREVPQINLDQGKGICPSIKRLFEKEPRLEVLEGLSIINHRIGVINGIIDSCEMGKTMAQVKGLTNTLRFQHTTVVNLPKPDRPYAKDIRASLIAPEGFVLCGSDMSSLEDRIKQHFIYFYDPDYVNSMNQSDFDPHLTVAGLAGMLTEEQIAAYKSGDKTLKRIRDIAKNGNYASGKIRAYKIV